MPVGALNTRDGRLVGSADDGETLPNGAQAAPKAAVGVPLDSPG
jgi:hypothetical protein